jgi:IS5 family transposase
MRRVQLSFGDGLIAEEVSDLREGWMEHADRVLADEQIVAAVYEALARRHPKSRSRGRLGAPAEVVLRLLILKHVRNWSYYVLEREVRANLVYRDFTRVGGGKTPDAKTMGRWGLAVDPDTIKQIHDRMVQIAQEQGVTQGRRMRVDTTVVETNIHHPTDSTLLGDGVRVLIRTMKKITKIVGGVGTKLRDRSRSVKLRAEITGARSKANHGSSRAYGNAQFQPVKAAVLQSRSVKRSTASWQWRWKACAGPMSRRASRARQTRLHFRGDTRSEGKLLSLFEPSTEIIRKGKAGKPNEFGKMVKLQEAENQIVIDYDVYDRRRDWSC